MGFVRYFATERRDRGSGRPRGSFRGGRGRGRGGRDDQRRSPRGGDRKEYGRMSRSSDDRPRRSASSERFSDRARPSRRRFVPRGGRGGRTGRDIGERSDRKSVSDRGRPDKARGGRVSGRGSSRGGRSAARDDDERPNRKPEFRKNRDEDTLGTINRPSTPIFNPPGAKPFASAASTATKPQKKAPKPAEIEGKPSTTSTMMPGGERLAKRIARCGVCSRRAAEELIRNGAVMVDGSIVTTPAINVYPGSQIIVNGQPVRFSSSSSPRSNRGVPPTFFFYEILDFLGIFLSFREFLDFFGEFSCNFMNFMTCSIFRCDFFFFFMSF